MPDEVDAALVDELVTATARAYVARAFVELQVPEHLNDGAKSLDALAGASGTDAPTLRRLMRAAAAIGLCREGDPGQFMLTVAGHSLHSAASGNAAGWLRLMTGPGITRAWERLADTARTGESQFSNVHGVGFWQYVAQHPDEAAIFDGAMTSGARQRADDLLEATDFSTIEVVVDVGGGQGLLAAALLSSTPHLRAVVADRPEVIATPDAAVHDAGDRIQTIATDFFAEVPAGGDLYVLSRIVHDWPDADAAAILRNCRSVMTDNARLCLLEQIAPDSSQLDPDERLALAIKDLNMLVLVGGGERTLADYSTLLSQAHLEITAVHKGAGCDVILAAPAQVNNE